MMKKLIWKIPGLIILILGIILMIGWLAHFRFLVQFSSTQVPIVFNASLCLALSGIALLLNNTHQSLQRVRFGIGCFLVILASAILSQDLFNFDLGVDELFIKSWFNYLVPHPGRMAPSTAVGFILTGLVFVLFSFARNKKIAVSIDVLIFLIFLIGLFGLFGYLLNKEFLYSWYSFSRMSSGIVIAFIFLSISLWLEWHHNSYADKWYEGEEDKKIILVSSAILLLITLIAGFSCIFAVFKQQNHTIGKMFQEFLHTTIYDIQKSFNRVELETAAIQYEILTQKLLLKENNKKQLNRILNFFLTEGFSAINIYNQQGKLLASVGQFVTNPDIAVPLKNMDTTHLIWKNEWYLELIRKIDNKTFIKVEWPLHELQHLLMDTQDITKTTEYMLCVAKNSNEAECFPSRLNPIAHTIQRKGINDHAVAMIWIGKKGF
jgi:hypothetical protein